jgi:hypothetical protein
MGILREFFETSKTDLVFSRSGNIAAKFYQILGEAANAPAFRMAAALQTDQYFTTPGIRQRPIFWESGVSPKTIQEWMGWSDKAFVLYYSHATKQWREQAGPSLERLAGHIPQST